MKIVEQRFLRGPNVHSPRPCFEAILDLEALDEISSAEVPGFTERLVEMLPGLNEHRCSTGYRGGFVHRLHEGTYMAHITEHVLIELQVVAGSDIGFGKARSVHGRPRHYRIVCSYLHEPLVEAALPVALDMVRHAAEGKPYDAEAQIARLIALGEDLAFGPSTRALLDAAERRGIPWRRLDDESSLVQLGFGRFRQRIQAATTSFTGSIATEIASDKQLTKKLLSEAGLPVPEGVLVRDAEAAAAALRKLGAPLTLKPLDGNQGKGVTTRVTTEAEAVRAYEEASQYSPAVIVERTIAGEDHRVLVVGDRVVAAARRMPPRVIGDGKSSIAALVARENERPERGRGHSRALTRIPLDEQALQALARQGWTLDSVLPEGATARLRDSANLSTGGSAEDVTDDVHPDVAFACIRAAQRVGLDIAGVDLMCHTISRPLGEQGGAILEVNAAPGLRMHAAPSIGRARAVGEAIIDTLFPEGSDGRIPIVAITGTNGKTTTAVAMDHVAAASGFTVGRTSSYGVFIQGRCVQDGDCSGYWSSRIVLDDPTVDFAVLESARGGIMKRGLAFDRCDVGVVLNVTSDHLGQDGLETLDDLIWAKSVVARAATKALVLNAEDEGSLAMREHRRPEAALWLFSLDPTNPVLREHLEQGGNAVYLDGDRIILKRSRRTTPLVTVQQLPFTWEGRARFNVANAMAVLAATAALRLPLKTSVQALQTFRSDVTQNPLRLNLFEIGQVQVLTDYAHNVPAYRALIQTARRLANGPLIGVVSAPGDRRDEDLREIGRVCAEGFDQLLVFEIDEWRGREWGVAANLVAEGARHVPEKSVSVVYDVRQALKQAITEAPPGALVVFGCASDLSEFGELQTQLRPIEPQAAPARTEALGSLYATHSHPNLRPRPWLRPGFHESRFNSG